MLHPSGREGSRASGLRNMARTRGRGEPAHLCAFVSATASLRFVQDLAGPAVSWASLLTRDEESVMRRTTFGPSKGKRRRAALSVDVRAMIEAHLRDLAQAGRLSELARSRRALARHYREQGNDAAVYCLAGAPDFSLAVTPAGGVLLTLRRTGDLVSWSREVLLKKGP